MREIKYRGWDRIENRMVNINSLDFPFDRPSGKHMSVDALDGNEWRAIDEVHLMQYTGLKDKNRKEIYEGDIVDQSYTSPMTNELIKRHYVVEWENGKYEMTFIKDKMHYDRYLWMEFTKVEVIGNIYENPDLLNQ